MELGNWRYGAIEAAGRTFRYAVKVFDVGSQYGIDGGRISKLTLRIGGAIVAMYDREWVTKPKTPEAEEALLALLRAYNAA